MSQSQLGATQNMVNFNPEQQCIKVEHCEYVPQSDIYIASWNSREMVQVMEVFLTR